MNILLVGSGAREHAIAKAIKKSRHQTDLFTFGNTKNPAIMSLSTEYYTGDINDIDTILEFALTNSIELAIIGPETPLAAGIVGVFNLYNIKTFGPTKTLAQLESSKGFTRNLLEKYQITGNPKFKNFIGSPANNKLAISDFISELGNDFVVKYDNLYGGKGVKVSGEHLHSQAEGIDYALECLKLCGKVVIEEKLIGQEFSLIAITDGITVLETPAIQDHKRAYYGDVGPNTGGMGTYSDADHSLPFLTKEDIEAAHNITVATMKALEQECEEKYKGVMYGGFMATKNGVYLIEYNARFGDPEAMNIFTLLKTDFVDLCLATINESLAQIKLEFENLATVCKYIVPSGYPDAPIKNQEIKLKELSANCEAFMGSVYENDKKMFLAGSRAIAFVGTGKTIFEAEKIAQAGLDSVSGPIFSRQDIGTKDLVQKRIDHMKTLRSF